MAERWAISVDRVLSPSLEALVKIVRETRERAELEGRREPFVPAVPAARFMLSAGDHSGRHKNLCSRGWRDGADPV